jgi:hypothetical protein
MTNHRELKTIYQFAKAGLFGWSPKYLLSSVLHIMLPCWQPMFQKYTSQSVILQDYFNSKLKEVIKFFPISGGFQDGG